MSADKSPLVSIYILCFNHEKYVAEAIESVINQTYSNIEIVIVDNASTDSSKYIIEDFVKKDKRIKFFPMKYNTLPSFGSNFALKQCTGQYVASLSADDCYEYDKISKQLKFMQVNNLDLSFTWVSVIDDFGKKLENHFIEEWFNQDSILSKNDLIKFLLSYENRIHAITTMFSQKVLDKINFDNRLLQTQDLDLWIRVLPVVDNVSVLFEKLTKYRVLNADANLSLIDAPERYNRTSFEMIYVYKNFLSYSESVLSDVLSLDVNSSNKLYCLYDFFKNTGNFFGQFAILQFIYDNLGSDCDPESPLFQFFFREYSSLRLNMSNQSDSLACKVDQLSALIKKQDDLILERDDYIVELEKRLESKLDIGFFNSAFYKLFLDFIKKCRVW